MAAGDFLALHFLAEWSLMAMCMYPFQAGEEEETQEAAWQLITAACATLPDVADLFPSAALPETADILSSLTHEPLPRGLTVPPPPPPGAPYVVAGQPPPVTCA